MNKFKQCNVSKENDWSTTLIFFNHEVSCLIEEITFDVNLCVLTPVVLHIINAYLHTKLNIIITFSFTLNIYFDTEGHTDMLCWP